MSAAFAAAVFAVNPAVAQSYNTAGSSAVAQQQATTIISTSNASILASNIGSSLGASLGGGFGGGGFGGGGFGPRSESTPTNANSVAHFNSRTSGRSAGAGERSFGSWFEASYINLENNGSTTPYEGDAYTLTGALDYRINDRVLIGAALGYETSDIDTTFNAGKLESSGFGITPFIGYALTPNWSLAGMFNYTWVEYDISRSNSTIRGSYDAERWFAGLTLSGSYAVNRVRLMPEIGLLYLEETSDAYRESSGTTVGENTSRLGRLSAGGKVGYAFETFMPYAKLIGEYDFKHDDETPLGNGRFTAVDDYGGRIGGGIQFFGNGRVSGTVEGTYDSLGRTDLDVISVRGRLNVKF